MGMPGAASSSVSSTTSTLSPNSAFRRAMRASGTSLSDEKRRASSDRFSSLNRFLAQASSEAEQSRPPTLPSGSEGWDSTGATTAGSVIIARAKPPVKHMPTAPTPLPPHSSCALRARARSQSTIGLERPSFRATNSRRTQMFLKISPTA